MPIIPSVGGATRMTSILQGRSGLGTDHIPTKHPPQLLHHYTRLALMSLTQLEFPSWSWPWQLTWLAALAKSQRQERPTTAHWCSCPFASLGPITENLLRCFSKCLDHINGATSHAAYWQLATRMPWKTRHDFHSHCSLPPEPTLWGFYGSTRFGCNHWKNTVRNEKTSCPGISP